jgi:ABC-2 type transport system ATP-binding protein
MQNSDHSVIQTVGLTKVFKDFWHRQRVVAVDHLDLDIHQNEVFGLLGPNGSGKSTTIKMLLGLLYPTRGRIRVLGRPPTDVAVKSRIGYLPEESYLYRFLNARETLDYYGRLFQIPRQDRHRRVEQLLEMVGLTREARRRVGEYSKGMARRIGLAQALINDPDLLILDEPTTGLDPIGTREIKDLIVFLNREKRKTILLCSHLLSDVEDVCQRVVILYGGKRQAMGDIHELLSQQNLTQITTERLTEETINHIRSLIEKETHNQSINVTTPSDKLETLFLRIVRQAQETRQMTSGVTSGGQIAGFLAESDASTDAVVQSLVTAGQRPVGSEGAGVDGPSATTTPEEGLINQLVSDTVSSDVKNAGPSIEQPSPQLDVDRSLIEQFIQRPDKAKE